MLQPEQERRLLEQTNSHPEAFRELYRAYFPRVYGYVAARMEHHGDAEDVTADIFVRVVESLDRFEYRGEGSFAAWLFRIAQNHVNDFYRTIRRKGEPLPLHDIHNIPSEAIAPDTSVIEQERDARLRQMIETLSPRRQEIIRLRFFAGLRNQEIAAVLGLDERTISAHLCRALEDLQTKYSHELDEEIQS
jgi:RNA polymerase sigma-70 factor (ECF subfamily)